MLFHPPRVWWFFDIEGRVRQASASFVLLTGLSHETLGGLRLEDLFGIAVTDLGEASKGTLHLHDGRPLPVLVRASRLAGLASIEPLLVVTIHPITSQQAETDIDESVGSMHAIDDALRMLSASNQAILTARDEIELAQEVCRLIVEGGKFAFVWVGRAERDTARTVEPVAWAGLGAKAFPTEFEARWDESLRGRGPVGTAIRTGTTSEEQTASSNHDLRCVVAFPLRIEQTGTWGALCLCARGPTKLSPREMTFLQEIAASLRAGLAYHRERKAAAVRTEALTAQKRRLEVLSAVAFAELQAVPTDVLIPATV